MIGFFTLAGDVHVDQVFVPCLRTFSKLVKNQIREKSYGDNLSLILIQFWLEGQFRELPKEKIHVRRYSKKEQAITVIVGVPRGFEKMSESEKRDFITSTTLESVIRVEEKYEKKDYFRIDFNELIDNLKKCITEYQVCEIK